MELNDGELSNFFYSVLLFGEAAVVKLVAANDIKDAFQTIKTNYDLAQITTLISVAEIEQVYLEINNNPSITYIFEFKDTKDGVVFNRTLEKDLSLVEIYKKYEEIPAFILSKENAGELLNTIIEQIIESSDPPLISKNYHL